MNGRTYDPWYVYELIDPRSGVPFYIGKTCTPHGRFSAHKSDPASAAYYTLKVLAEAGHTAEMKIVAEFQTEGECLEYETYLIDRTPGLVNRTGAYNRSCGSRPTKPFRRPVTGGEELVLVPDEDLRPTLELRADRLHQIMNGSVSLQDVKEVLEAIHGLRHEDAEYFFASDE